MAELIAFVSNSLVTAVLLGYVVILWLGLTIWTAMDIFARTGNPLARIGAIILVGLGFLFGFVLYLIIRPSNTTEESRTRDFEQKILENQSHSFVCPNCLELVREDFLFCPACGFTLRRECPSCKKALEIMWTQCPYCGFAVGPAALPKIPEAPKLLPQKSNGSFLGVFRKIFSSPAVEPTEIKRGRGRPRKPEPTEPVIKRPRGRPRKDSPVTVPQ